MDDIWQWIREEEYMVTEEDGIRQKLLEMSYGGTSKWLAAVVKSQRGWSASE